MYDNLPALVNSRQGFAGCIATVKLNGRLYNLWTDAISKTPFVSEGCSDATGFCKADSCKHFGTCMEGVSTFICDCNMTSHIGRICTEGKNLIDYMSWHYLVTKHIYTIGLLVTFD